MKIDMKGSGDPNAGAFELLITIVAKLEVII